MLSFGPFTLNRQDGRLSRPGAATAELKPKALSLLLALADNAGRLVSKDELLDRVWGTRYITNGVIKTQMAELRAVLEDDPKSPRWIETVHGRGYRFLSSVSAAPPVLAAAPVAATSDLGAQVGRTGHLVALQRHLQRAMQGTPTLVGIAGDPGVGKSMLLATFTASLEGVRVVSGQCAEQWGGTEPYLPILNALDRLCSSEPGVVETVRDVAPMWLGQMPWHLKSDERAQLQAQIAGAAPERMLREFGALLDRLAMERPLVWLIEDVHWADPATVHLVAALARRQSTAALMVVVTFRPVDLAFLEHPFGDLRRELRAKRQFDEIVLDGLALDDVGQLVVRRYGQAAADPAFIERLHVYTEGLPLFVLGVLDELQDLGVIRVDTKTGEHVLAQGAALQLAVPQSLADTFDRQVRRLPAEVCTLLETASLAGANFDHCTLAKALGQPADDTLAHLEALVRRGIWLRAAGVATLPDGRIAMQCDFRHAVIRRVLAARVGALASIQLHRRWAASLHEVWGDAVELAHELAMHHEKGRQPLDAARHLAVAARTALQRHAPREALALAERGLDLLGPLGQGAETAMLPLLSVRMTASILLEGMASETARGLVKDLMGRLDTLPVATETLPLWQVALLTHLTGRLPNTTALVERFAALAGAGTPGADKLAQSIASNALGIEALHHGRVGDSVAHFERTLAVLEGPVQPALLLRDPRAEAWSYLCLAAPVMGAESLSLHSNANVEAMITRGADLITHAMARWFQAYGEFFKGDAKRVMLLASETAALLESRRASPFLQPHRIAMGWACAALGDAPRGASLAADALERYLEQGSRQGLSGLYAVVADAHLLAGQPDKARAYVDDGIRAAQRGGDGFALVELHRLQALVEPDGDLAQAMLRGALRMTEDQRVPLLQARVALSLKRHMRAVGSADEADRVGNETWASVPDFVKQTPAGAALVA